MCPINDSHMMHDPWDMECNRQNYFVILDHFLPFYLSNNLKSQNFEKMKKTPGDITILHRRNINHNHTMHGSWDTKCNRQNFLLFWAIFCPFTRKSKFWKNEKNIRDNIILYMCTLKDNHMMYGSWDMECDGQNFLSF